MVVMTTTSASDTGRLLPGAIRKDVLPPIPVTELLDPDLQQVDVRLAPELPAGASWRTEQ